ncbi:MAG TPA: DUF2071 domain-containing protein [Pyrinomonadaceae bacterium]|nr:DUF2071 domain-containing protein [Pyrinomonadaceae bacterium]
MKPSEPLAADRLAMRKRPLGRPLMHQNWGKLLFMHWRIDPALLRPLIPAPLEIDTCDGSAWIGVVPFTMWGIRASFLPAIPGTSAFHELNVRTYVYHRGVPSVLFLSLDAANRLAVWGARTVYHLPYFNAQMSLSQTGNTISYSSVRKDRRGAPAELQATWNIGEALPATVPGSLEFFLTERYALDCEHNGKLYRARIHHQPWPLRQAELKTFSSSMIESHSLPTLPGDPLLHYCEELSVEIWPLKKIKD